LAVSDKVYKSGHFLPCCTRDTFWTILFFSTLGLNGKQEMVSPSPRNSITKLSEHSHISGSNDSTPFPPPHGSAVTLPFLASAHVEIAWQVQVPSCGSHFLTTYSIWVCNWFLGCPCAAIGSFPEPLS